MLKGLKNEIKRLHTPSRVDLCKRGGFTLGIAFVVSIVVGSYGMLVTKVISIISGM